MPASTVEAERKVPATVANPKYPATYHGGAVIHEPRLYVVVWGPRYPPSILNALQHFIAGLGGSAFGAVLAEYYDTTGYIRNDITLAGTWTDPTAPAGPVSLNDIDVELARATSRAGWPVDTNTILAVMLPPETPRSSGDACGTHGAALTTHPHRDPIADNAPPAYLMIPYPGPGCLFSDVAVDDLTLIFSHELAEAITQPFNIGSEGQSGWWGFTSGGNGTTPPPLAQIADACEPTGSTLSLSNGGTAYVSNILDLNQGHCVSFK